MGVYGGVGLAVTTVYAPAHLDTVGVGHDRRRGARSVGHSHIVQFVHSMVSYHFLNGVTLYQNMSIFQFTYNIYVIALSL